MQNALKNTPVTPLSVPAGVVSEGGDWFFQEFTRTTGVTHLGIEGHDTTGETAADTEKKKILDMFKE